MISNNPVEQIQRQYTFAVQPVHLFETRKNQELQKSNFDFINQMQQSGNNPFHPNYSNTEKAQKLDLMG